MDSGIAHCSLDDKIKCSIDIAKALIRDTSHYYRRYTTIDTCKEGTLEQEVKERKVADTPSVFHDDEGKLNKHAQAYYGLFKFLFEDTYLVEQGLNNEKLVELAFSIDQVVTTAVAEFSINPAEIENAISMKLLPMLFADLGIDKAQQLIEEVLKITRLGLARG